jgi:hypothetical protein
LSWDNTENTHPSLVFGYQWVLLYQIVVCILKLQCKSYRPNAKISVQHHLNQIQGPTQVYRNLKEVRDCSYHQPGAKCFR